MVARDAHQKGEILWVWGAVCILTYPAQSVHSQDKLKAGRRPKGTCYPSGVRAQTARYGCRTASQPALPGSHRPGWWRVKLCHGLLVIFFPYLHMLCLCPFYLYPTLSYNGTSNGKQFNMPVLATIILDGRVHSLHTITVTRLAEHHHCGTEGRLHDDRHLLLIALMVTSKNKPARKGTTITCSPNSARESASRDDRDNGDQGRYSLAAR